MGDDYQKPITEDMDEFGIFGVKSLSYNQSIWCQVIVLLGGAAFSVSSFDWCVFDWINASSPEEQDTRRICCWRMHKKLAVPPYRRHRTYLQRLSSRMHRRQLLVASRLHVCVLDFGVSDVSLNDVLNLSRKCAVCEGRCGLHSNLQLQRGFCGEFRLSEFCGHVLSCLGKSLHTQSRSCLAHRGRHGRGCVPQKQFCSSIHSPPFLCQSWHPTEMPKSAHACRTSISTNLRKPRAVIYQVSQTLPNP